MWCSSLMSSDDPERERPHVGTVLGHFLSHTVAFHARDILVAGLSVSPVPRRLEKRLLMSSPYLVRRCK